MGGYPKGEGPFLNPNTKDGLVNWSMNNLPYTKYDDPSTNLPGDIGDIIYFPYYNSDWKDSFAMTSSFVTLQQSY